MDQLGITDALDCFTTGSLGSCGATAITVISSFLGGVAGKVAAKYGLPWKWAKGAALAKRLWKVGDKLIGAVKDWFKGRKELKATEEAIGEVCSIKNSFTPDTRVLMADGTTKAIADVKIGDKVKATDPETGETKTETVTAEIKGQGLKHLVKVTIDTDGANGTKTASVTATDGHPFWSADLGEWVDATDLKAGEWLRTSAGTFVQVAAVKRWTTGYATVHNLTVGELHTYYVVTGDVGVLVHNMGRKPGQRPNYSAEGPHTTFERHGGTGQVKKYAEWALQSNPRNPAPFELVKRFDLEGPAHTNADGTVVETPHINSPNGGDARALEEWEKPLGCS